MRNGKRGRYRQEFEHKAVRLAAGSLGVVEQTLCDWMKAHRAGMLQAVVGKSAVTVLRG
jgi:transposase-like protein